MTQTRMDNDSNLNNETAIKEVQYLLKNGTVQLTPDIINRLRSKYSDDSVVDSIMEYFSDRTDKLKKVASIFMEAFQRKYKDNFYTMSLSKFMKRAYKYKKRYELSDEEFDEIRRTFEAKIFSSSPNLGVSNVVYPNTNLSRVLGYPITESTDKIKPTHTDDYTYLQDILRNYAFYRGIHSYIVIQTMMYEDLSQEAINGKIDLNKHDVNRYVHPVLAALFLPKLAELEERMLYANIAGIINSRYNGERIITKPDYELFYSMVVDPTDTVCDVNSPMRDLKNRSDVQAQVWNNVYQLRNGKYYDATVLDFIAHIDKCKISNVDNPDLLYLSDEGVILRRLFSVFSFRPIIVSTQPIFGVITNNPLNLPVNTGVITSIPYITYKLPQVHVQGQVYNLEDSNNQVQFYLENGSFVPKATHILDCRGPLIFYVPRRSVALPIPVANPQLSPFGFNHLQQSTRHYNKVNSVEINFNETMTISKYGQHNNVNYHLRSAIAYERYQDTSIILGHVTYLFKYDRDPTTKEIINSTPIETLCYMPRKANLLANNNFAILGSSWLVAREELCKSGTVFIYNSN